LRRYLTLVPNGDVAVDAYLAANPNVVANFGAAGYAHLGRKNTVMSYLNVVCQMAQVVYFGTCTDSRGAHHSAVHAGVRANFNIVGKLRPPDVRDFAVPG
jgi:hypothetical protein